MTVEGNGMASALPWQGAVAANAPNSLASGTDAGRFVPLLADLHDALAGAWIETHYQPIVRMRDRRPVALEVLARLRHPVHGLLLPGRFIQPMETAGLGWQLTEAVLQRAFDDWTDERLEALDLSLAFNFPLEVLLRSDALAQLEALRADAGIAARRVVVELTEGSPLPGLAELAIVTRRLRALGYGIAIDDVGPDLRDHRGLLDLGFTELKLDMTLVRDALVDPRAQHFLADAIEAAGAAGLTVTAEGVEDEATWERMCALGVDHAQGYLISRPLPLPAVAAWHHEWNALRPVY